MYQFEINTGVFTAQPEDNHCHVTRYFEFLWLLLRHFVLASMLSLALSSVVSQDWKKGLGAYGVGDYATALLEWWPLAEQGDANA